MKLVVNADDFGLSHEKNIAIDELMRKGVCTNASIVVNMPYFEEAVLLAKSGNYAERLSLHINLTVGESLSSKIRKHSLYYVDGEFAYTPVIKRNIQVLPFHIQAIREELEHQIQKFIDAGLELNSIDSHNWVHLRLPVWLALRPLIHKYKISIVRPMWDGYKREEIATLKWSRYFTNLEPILLKEPACRVYKHTSNIEQFLLFEHELQDMNIVEVFTHPDIVNGCILDTSSSYTKQEKKLVVDNVALIGHYKHVTVKQIGEKDK